MSLPLVAGLAIVALALGYRYYGRSVARRYRSDDLLKTPAERFQDGVDFIPTSRFYLLGQHFSAIAAAGPIAGPIIGAISGVVLGLFSAVAARLTSRRRR